MAAVEIENNVPAEFSYHLLRNALDQFGRNLSDLDPSQYQQVQHKAARSFELESLVLGSDEAKGLVISQSQLDASVDEVASRYTNDEEFEQDLEANGLSKEVLRRALQRELMFDSVMQKVASKSADVNDIDMRLFYEMHSDRFESPETRVARHILITINDDYIENTRQAALKRMDAMLNKLNGRINRFQDMAKRFSECPTAMEGGKLGEVRRGVLYPELDAVLFNMYEGEISQIVESEVGFHVLYCEKIKPGKRLPYTKAAPKILEILQDRRMRNCQKSWLAELQQMSNG